MSEKPTQPNERPPSEAEKQEDVRTQHFHRVFGRDNAERNTSQKVVVSFLEDVVNQQSFQLNGRTFAYDPLHAAQREGERNLARAILLDIKREPVSQTKKPTVSKG